MFHHLFAALLAAGSLLPIEYVGGNEPCCPKVCPVKGKRLAVLEKIRDASVTISVGGHHCGSGTVLGDDEAFVVTAAHLFEDGRDSKPILISQHRRDSAGKESVKSAYAVLLKQDAKADVALLGLGKGYWKSAVKVGKSDSKIGQELIHCGTPQSPFRLAVHHSLAWGKISAEPRVYGGYLVEQGEYGRQGGCSGGGVFNSSGELIGVHSMSGGPTIGFFVPARVFRKVLCECGADCKCELPCKCKGKCPGK